MIPAPSLLRGPGVNVGVNEAGQERLAPAVNDLGVCGDDDPSSDRRGFTALDNDRTQRDDMITIEDPGIPNRFVPGLR